MRHVRPHALQKVFWLIAIGLLLWSCEQTPSSAMETPLEIKVLVINLDPLIPEEGNRPLHEVYKWNDPRQLAEGYMKEIEQASGGFIRYKIVEWRDVNAFPVKEDGFVYTPETFKECWENRETCHQPDGSDYPLLLETHGVVPRIDRGEIDELWIFGAPYFGFWESAMAGPGAFYINGGVYDSVKASRPFAIMGFSYERGVAEMMHNLSHRTESSLERIYGGWEVDKLTSNWARFAANAHQSNGVAAVGTCHYPPNGEKDYDYANPREVESSADDWLNYPKLTGKKTLVSCETWGGPNYHLNYLRWWFSRLPKAPGVNPDGRQNNWWKYVFDFNRYTADGKWKE